MESSLLSSSAMTILSLSKALTTHPPTPLLATLHRRFSAATLGHLHLARSARFGPGSVVRGLDLRRSQLQFAARCTASFGGGGFGGVDGGKGGGGGGDGAADGGDGKRSAAATGAGLSSDVIILDVGGMTCGGCAASVKRILESQPQVSSASVNLTTETAIIWPVSDAKVAPNWKKEIGEALAKHLTSCGFTSNLKDQGAIDGDIQL